MDPLQFAFRVRIVLEDAVIFLLHRKPGSSVRILLLDLPSVFNTLDPVPLDKLERIGGGVWPGRMDFGLPHKQAAVCGQGMDIEWVDSYLNNKLDWTQNTNRLQEGPE